MKRIIAAAILTLSLTGCAFHQAPYITYKNAPALSQTAVFAAFNNNLPDDFISILAVDDKPTSCAQVGCPLWVRVLPGQHSFLLRYVGNFMISGPFITSQRSEINVTVPEMKAGHVYQANYRIAGDYISVIVKDLGEKPNFGITLGLKGFNKKYYPVEF